MKIGFDAKRIFHNWRGLGNYSRDLVLGLKSLYPENEYLLFTPNYEHPDAIKFEHEFGKNNIITPEKFFYKNFPSIWRRSLAKVSSAYEIDLFHGLSHEIPHGLKKRGIKSVVTIHDLIFLRYPEYFPWIDRKVYFSKIRHAVNSSDTVIAICEQTKNDLIRYFNVNPQKVEICYQSCNEKFQSGPVLSCEVDSIMDKFHITKNYFLYVGALEERKNILNLIEGFSYFGTSRDLIIVGKDRKYKENIELKIKQCNLDNNVRILTNVTTNELHALYSGADLFCFPSFFEGFGIPIIESMFCGTPVLTSNGSCFPEVGGNGAIYIDPNSPIEIAKAMHKVTNDQSFYEYLICEGKKQVKKFTTAETNKSLHQVYQKTVLSV